MTASYIYKYTISDMTWTEPKVKSKYWHDARPAYDEFYSNKKMGKKGIENLFNAAWSRIGCKLKRFKWTREEI